MIESWVVVGWGSQEDISLVGWLRMGSPHARRDFPHKFRICWEINGLPWWLRWLSICLQCRRPRFNTIPGLGRPPGEGNGNPLQYSCLQNPMDGGAWEATIHGVAKSRTQLSDFTFFSFFLYPSSKVLYVCFVGMEVGKLLVNHPSWFSSPDAFF